MRQLEVGKEKEDLRAYLHGKLSLSRQQGWRLTAAWLWRAPPVHGLGSTSVPHSGMLSVSFSSDV